MLMFMRISKGTGYACVYANQQRYRLCLCLCASAKVPPVMLMLYLPRGGPLGGQKGRRICAHDCRGPPQRTAAAPPQQRRSSVEVILGAFPHLASPGLICSSLAYLTRTRGFADSQGGNPPSRSFWELSLIRPHLASSGFICSSPACLARARGFADSQEGSPPSTSFWELFLISPHLASSAARLPASPGLVDLPTPRKEIRQRTPLAHPSHTLSTHRQRPASAPPAHRQRSAFGVCLLGCAFWSVPFGVCLFGLYSPAVCSTPLTHR